MIDTSLCFFDKNVIVRTYSAGVWFGRLEKKYRDEVILTEARRLWSVRALKSVSLSSVAINGVDHTASAIAEPLAKVP